MRAKTRKRAEYKLQKIREQNAHRSVQKLMFAGVLICALGTVGVWQTRKPEGYCYIFAPPIPLHEVEIKAGKEEVFWDWILNCGTEDWEWNEVRIEPSNDAAKNFFTDVRLDRTESGEVVMFFFVAEVPKSYEPGTYTAEFRLEVNGKKFGDTRRIVIKVPEPVE